MSLENPNTYAKATQWDNNDLYAVMVSGKNPDETDWVGLKIQGEVTAIVDTSALAKEAKQDTEIALLTDINNTSSAIEDDTTNIAQDTANLVLVDYATSAKQDTAQSSLTNIDSATTNINADTTELKTTASNIESYTLAARDSVAAIDATTQAMSGGIGDVADASADGDAASGSIIARLRAINKELARIVAGTDKLAVMNSDGTNVGAVIATTVTGSANGAGQFEVTAIDVSSYKTISLQRTGTYNLTCQFECSNDNTTWVACPMQNVASVPLAENTSVTGAGNGLFSASVNFKYFRSRISAYTSGTVNTTLVLSTLASTPPTQQVSARQDGDFSVGPSVDQTLLASAARTTTQTVADQANSSGRGIRVVLDMTNVAAGPSVTLTIEAKDNASGKYSTLLAGAAVTTVSTNVYVVYPGLTPVANKVVSDVLPRTWRVTVTANNANSGTYSVGASYLT